MKIKIFFLLSFLCSLTAQAQVENFAIRLSTNGNVDCGLMPELNGRDAYALQFWMNADEWTKGATLLQRGEGLRIWLSDINSITATIGNQQLTLNSTFLVAGRWNHIMLLSDGKQIYFYINGNRAKALTSQCIIPDDNESSFIIGGDQYKGRIDEIRVWNTAPIDTYNYFVHTTLNKWVPQLDNLVAYFKGDQELCPNLVDYKALFDPTSEFNHHGTFSTTGASLEKVTDNTGLPYLLNGAYTENSRFYDRAIDRDKYLLANDLIILGITSYNDGHLEYTSPNDHGTISNGEYLEEFEGHTGVLNLMGEGAKMTSTTTALVPPLVNGVAQGYSFETWIYLDKWTEGAYIFRKESDDGQHGFSISLGSEDLKAVVVKVNGKKYVNRSKLEIKKWIHMAVTTNAGGTTRTTFMFAYNGEATYATASLSDETTDDTPTEMDKCVAIIGENLSAKLDETVIWNQRISIDDIRYHMTEIPFPAISKTVTAQTIMKAAAYYRYDHPEHVGYDSYSQDEWRRIMLSAYEGYRGYQVRISVRGHNNWQTTISNASRRKIFAADLARLSEGYDGVELDLEWMDGTQTNLGLLADDILEALPEGKTLMISCHAYGAYQFPKAKISKINGFTFQQYGPQNTFFNYNNFISSYNNFVNYGFPKNKIYLSYSTTTSQGYKSDGTKGGDVVGIRNGFLEGDYSPNYTSNVDTHTYNNCTYYFMGPGQVYRRAKHCVDNNLQGIFYWDMGNDVATSHPYSIPKVCNYALNCNVDSLVTEVTINHPTAIKHIFSLDDEAKVQLRLHVDGQYLTADLPSNVTPKQVTIYSVAGNLLISNPGSTIRIESLPKGVYIVRIALSNGGYVSRTFIKQ